MIDGGKMRLREITDMNLIANAGSVLRRIVGAEDIEPVQSAGGSEKGARNKMRLGLMTLGKLALRIGSGRVEIT